MSTRTNKRNGLILLVVLGMLALFSIITVSFVVFSSNSNKASTMVAQVKLRQPNSRQLATLTLRQIMRGTTDNQSAFFGHDLLGDIYGNAPQIYPGRPSTLGEFRPVAQLATPRDGVYVINSMEGTPSFLKVPLAPTFGGVPLLSNDDDAYNGRLFTFLGGPLKGKTFRILHYIGNRTNTSDPDYYLRFSVLLSLTDLDSAFATDKSVRGEQTRSIGDWLVSAEGPNVLAYSATDYSNASTYVPYRFLINDAPFTGVGYGLSTTKRKPNFTSNTADDIEDPNFGNLGQEAWLVPNSADAGLPANLVIPGTGIPVGLLHNYNDPNDPFASTWRRGDTNEGFDAADYNDQYLAYQPPNPATSEDVIPSFHRPEVINHLVHLYGDPTAMNTASLIRMLNLIDYATARPLSITLRVSGNPVYQADAPFPGVAKSRNIRLRSSISNNTLFSSSLDLNLDAWPAPVEVAKLRNFVAWLINGEWDVDNDGDGIRDSMWLDPNLPLVNGPDGKLLKVMVAPMIESLDGRVNITTAGDLVQTATGGGYEPLTGFGFPRGNVYLSQGNGYGPAEISFASMLQTAPANLAPGFTFLTYVQSFFDQRNGRDDFPGQPGNDPASTLLEREQRDFHRHNQGPGLPLARRGGLALGLDRFGNPLLLNNVYQGLNPPSEVSEDPYEIRPRSVSVGDQPHTFGELERLIRRFDSSYSSLPSRLQKSLQIDQTYSVNSEINRLLTNRSSELRYPGMGAVSTATSLDANGNEFLNVAPGNMLGWVKLLHEQRFRAGSQSFPILDTPSLRLIFPLEFRLGLKLDINRAIGNGLDDDSDGQIDEPQELQDSAQNEFGVPGEYTFGFAGSPPRLASRQLLARQLYCLAQLIVPRDHRLPGMEGFPASVNFLSDPPTFPPPATPTPGMKFRSLRARLLAQWAVNIVDFRDSDAAMTKFPYDELPFGLNGGNPRPSDSRDDKAPGWAPQPGRVVWGLEFPELALSEVLAFHDTRVKDTDQDNDTGHRIGAPTDPDDDPDQYRLPQGSLFVEIQSLRTTGAPTDQTLPGAPSSLYEVFNGGVALNLAKRPVHPTVNSTFGVQPIWRLAMSDVQALGSTPNDLLRDATRAQLLANQFSAELTPSGSFAYLENGLIPDLDNIGIFNAATPPTPQRFDRVVLFTPTVPAVVPDVVVADQNRRVFYAENGSPNFYMPGGTFLVVGPRATTYLGSQAGPASPVAHLPSPQRFLMQASAFRFFKLDGVEENPYPLARKPTLTMIVSTDGPSPAWNDLPLPSASRPYKVGLNISEPIAAASQYYPIPTQRLNPTDADANGFPGFASMPRDSWKDYNTSAKTLPDKPFDTPAAGPGDYQNPVLNHPNRAGLYQVGTHENVRTIYLQRLADPELQYDPVDNPYITIDWISSDLTVFNGEDPATVGPGARMAFQSRYKDGGDVRLRAGEAGDLEPNGIKALVSATHPVQLPPEAMGAQTTPAGVRKPLTSSLGTQMVTASTAPLIETPTYNGPDVATKGAAAPAHFRFQMGYSSFPVPYANTAHQNFRSVSCSTLGYINVGRPLHNDRLRPAKEPNFYDGFGPPLNDPSAQGSFDGAPQLPVGSLWWFNRQYASPFEMMLVPPFGPGQVQQTVTISQLTDLFANPATSRSKPYGHLMSFFDSSPLKVANPIGLATSFWSRGVPTTVDTLPQNADLHLLFDLVETPQAYVDSSTYFNGRIAAPLLYSSGNTDADSIRLFMMGGYKAPYNRIPSYVNSGKININAIASERVWKAVESNYLRGTDRQGVVGNNSWPALANARRGYTVPVSVSHNFFTNPTHLNANLHPEVPTQFAGAFRSGLLANIAPDQAGTQSLRGTASDVITLFRRSAPGASSPPIITGSNTLSGISALGAYEDGDRQPAEAYKRLTRLANLVSKQSNVFAVHLTIGFFEYDPVEGIGREYEDQAGGLQRSRSFFIIDRSIPVGYRVGEDINTDNLILSSRFFD